MHFSLPELNYPLSALEPVISREALELHHGAHHKSYVEKLNAALEKAGWEGEESIEELLTRLDTLPEAIRKPVRNFGGGHANHCLLWETLTPSPSAPPPTLAKLIDRDFGDLATLREKMSAEANGLFGSGWSFLSWDPKARKLFICALPNQDSPLSSGHVPLLPCDVWEHAHYLVYRNRRADWVRDWWDLVDWKHVERRLETVSASAGASAG